MKNVTIIFALAFFVSATSCQPEVSEEVNFPIAESYSPGFVKTGDTVSVIGQYLDDASIRLGSVTPSLIKATTNELQFIVTDAMLDNSIRVAYSTGDNHTFSTKIYVNHAVTVEDQVLGATQALGEILQGPKQLLITDFDGAGIRVADATNRFDETQWESQVQTSGTETITENYLGVSSSLANGNYYAISLSDVSQLGGYGHVGAFNTRLELLNGNAGGWINNFSDYKNSSITKTNTSDLDDLYLNFAIFNNGSDKSLLRVYLKNDELSNGDAYASKNVNYLADNEWVWVSIPFSDLKTGYGFSNSSNDNNIEDQAMYESLNQISFSFAHDDEQDNSNASLNGTIAEGDVHFFIDHIILTQGMPYLGQP